MCSGLELPAEVDIRLQPEQIPEGQGLNKCPMNLASASCLFHILYCHHFFHSEIKEEARVQEAAPEFPPTEEEVEVTGFRGPAIGEEEAPFADQPELLQEVAAEAEAVAEAVAEGAAVVVEGVDGRTIIVLEDDGTILDEGPSPFAAGVKEEIVGEEIQQEVRSTGAV